MPTFLSKMVNDVFNNFTQFAVELNGVLAMNAGNQIRALANIDLISLTPLYPFVVPITLFHVLMVAFLRNSVKRNLGNRTPNTRNDPLTNQAAQ